MRPRTCYRRTAAQLRTDVALLMADGRERTASDIATKIGCDIHQAATAARQVREMGLIVAEEYEGGKIYRRAGR